jgi:hypothetical protein
VYGPHIRDTALYGDRARGDAFEWSHGGGLVYCSPYYETTVTLSLKVEELVGEQQEKRTRVGNYYYSAATLVAVGVSRVASSMIPNVAYNHASSLIEWLTPRDTVDV